MKLRKQLILFISLAFITVTAAPSLAKTRVYTSLSVAGIIGGGVYWYFSVGTQISKGDRHDAYAFLPRLHNAEREFPSGFAPEGSPERDRTLYLPLYSIKF